MPSVFISYSSKDLATVERNIIAPLKKNNTEVWYSTEEIKTTAEWETQILDGLKKCDWVLVALTPRAIASKWVKREIHWAVEKKEGHIIPLMLETCEPDELHLGLFALQYIDFRHDISKAQKQLSALLNFVHAKEERIQNRTEQAQQDIKRVQYDTATNWAIGTVGVAIYFAFSSPDQPHFLIPIFSLVIVGFLLLDIKRDNQGLKWKDVLAQRLLGIYLWIFILLTIVWNFKLYIHPFPVPDLDNFLIRASMGIIPGSVMIFACVILNLTLIIFTFITTRSKRSS